MRCLCCDVSLNDTESTRRLVSTGEFLDWCNKCYKGMEKDIPTYTREDFEENVEEFGWEKEYWEEHTNLEMWGDD